MGARRPRPALLWGAWSSALVVVLVARAALAPDSTRAATRKEVNKEERYIIIPNAQHQQQAPNARPKDSFELISERLEAKQEQWAPDEPIMPRPWATTSANLLLDGSPSTSKSTSTKSLLMSSRDDDEARRAISSSELIASLGASDFSLATPQSQSSLFSGSWSIRDRITSLFGRLAKGVVYGGATLARLNSRLLCMFLTHESELDNEDQPTLYAFNDPKSPERAYRIYADDQVSEHMLEEAGFDRAQMTIFLVHGWLGGIHNELWLTEAKNAALRVSQRARRASSPPKQASSAFRANVIVVDWSDLALGSLYTATQNSYKVSQRLGSLLRQFAQGGLRPQLMHCIGHSIGLHICGRAARAAFPQPAGPSRGPNAVAKWQKFGRISGVDPGGFCYELDIRSEPQFEGMRPSDALVTDAYYSNRSPFGNRYLVAQFNVRVNNAFLQTSCSVWRDPAVAREYFHATVRFLMGNVAHNDILTCDHYFATRLASQRLAQIAQDDGDSCSMVAVACNSYADFLRGRCGILNQKLDTNADENDINYDADGEDDGADGGGGLADSSSFYEMDFEYQRSRPTVSHAWRHLQRYTNQSRNNDKGAPGAVPYEQRAVYYTRYNGTNCSRLYRLRLATSSSGALLARLLDAEGESMEFVEPLSNKLVQSIRMHGPWILNEDRDNPAGFTWRTALIELPATSSVELFRARLDKVVLEAPTRGGQLQLTQLELLELDYLSSSSPKLRSAYSRSFGADERLFIHAPLNK